MAVQADTRARRPALIGRLFGLVTGRAAPQPAPVPAPAPAAAPRPPAAAPAVLYAAADADISAPVAAWLQAAGHRVIPAEGFGLALGEVLARRSAFGLLVVDIDGFGGPELVVARLMDLRRRAPSLPVIVISAEVQFHDFTAERLAVCDVTLRAPISAAALELALAEAAVNNLLWQARQLRGRRPPAG